MWTDRTGAGNDVYGQFVAPSGALVGAALLLGMENKGLNEAFTTEDFGEAMTARMEKRAPAFKGK